MRGISRFIARNAKLIIIIIIALTVGGAASITRARVSTSFLSLFRYNEPYLDSYHSLAEKYAGIEMLQVVLTAQASFSDRDTLLSFWEYLTHVRSLDGILHVATFLPVTRIGRSGARGITVSDIDDGFLDYQSRIENGTGLVQPLISQDRKIAAISLRLANTTDAELLLESLRNIDVPDGLSAIFTGSQIVLTTLATYLRRIYTTIPPIALIVLVAVFFLNVKSLKYTLVGLTPAFIGTAWMVQSVFWLGVPMEIVLIISPIFVLVMGSADGLHFVIHFLDGTLANKSISDKVELTLKHVGIPMILTTITTMIGFLSLCLSPVRSMRILGLFSAVGILYAGIISFFFLPAVLTRLKGHDGLHRTTGHFGTRLLLPKRRTLWIPLVVFLVLVVLSGLAMPLIDVDSSYLLFFRKSSNIRRDIEYAEVNLTASYPIVGEYMRSEGAFDFAALQDDFGNLLALERRLELLPGVRFASSVADTMDKVSETMFRKSGIPPPALLKLLLKQVPSIDSMLTSDGILFTVGTTSWNTDAFERVMDFFSSENRVTHLTGMPILFSRLNQLVAQSQRIALLVALGTVFLVLLIFFRSVKASIVSLVPILITVAGIYGLLFVTGIRINMLTGTISSIAVGIGIDYGIHLVPNSGPKLYTRI